MRASILLLTGWLALVSSLSITQHTREKRQLRTNVQNCQVSPSGIENPDQPAQTNSIVEIKCTTDSPYDFCHFEHTNPLDVNRGSQRTDNTIGCNMARGDSQSKQCADDNRITLTGSSPNQCGIRISNPSPEDTGKWIVTVAEVKQGTGGNAQFNTKIVG